MDPQVGVLPSRRTRWLRFWWLRRLDMWATSHARLGARDQLHFKHSHWWKRRSWSKFASHYGWGTIRVYMWIQYGCEVYMESYMVSIGSCCTVTWTIFKNHFLEVGLTRNQPGDRPWHSERSQLLIYCILSCVRTHMNAKFIEIAFGQGSGHTWLHWGYVTTRHGFWRCVGTAFRHFLLGRHNYMVTALGSCVKSPGRLTTVVLSWILVYEIPGFLQE